MINGQFKRTRGGEKGVSWTTMSYNVSGYD